MCDGGKEGEVRRADGCANKREEVYGEGRGKGEGKISL